MRFDEHAFGLNSFIESYSFGFSRKQNGLRKATNVKLTYSNGSMERFLRYIIVKGYTLVTLHIAGGARPLLIIFLRDFTYKYYLLM